MKFELVKTFPVARRTGFAFFMDVDRWPEWAPFEVEGDAGARFARKGDELAVVYRPFRIPVPGRIVLDEVKDGELIRATLSFPGAPAVHEGLVFHNAGTHAFILEAAMELDPGHWFERSMQWMTMLPLIVRRDLHRAMDRAHALLADGVLHKGEPKAA